MAVPPRKIRQLPPAQEPSDSDVFPVSQMNTQTGVATTRAMTRLQLQSDLIQVINEARQMFVTTANEEHAELREWINELQTRIEENEISDSNIQTAITMVQQMIAEGDGGKSAYQLWLELPGNSGKTIQQYFDAMTGPPGTTKWSGITDKPTSFTPSEHTHPISDVIGAQSALDGKANVSHTHNEGEIVGLADTLDDIQEQIAAASDKVPAWSEITGKPSSFEPSPHQHAIADVNGLQSALTNAAATPVQPTWDTLAGKPSTFPPSNHSHAITDVSGLQTALEGKLSSIAVTPSTPTRALNAAFRPSTTKATLVNYSVQVQAATPLLAGSATATVELLSDANATPTTVRARASVGQQVGLSVSVAITDSNVIPLSYIVPAGHYVLLKSTVAGTASASIVAQTEEALG